MDANKKQLALDCMMLVLAWFPMNMKESHDCPTN